MKSRDPKTFRRPPTPPTNWQWLPPIKDKDAHKTAVDELTTWVTWLIDRYEVESAIPRCWALHGAMLEELSALEAAWRGAYNDPDGQPQAGVIWHEQLHHCLARINEWNKERCTNTRHNTPAAGGPPK
jgi:hypothetical protein